MLRVPSCQDHVSLFPFGEVLLGAFRYRGLAVHGEFGGTLVECWRLWDYSILRFRELMYIGSWSKCFGGIVVILWPLISLGFGGFCFCFCFFGGLFQWRFVFSVVTVFLSRNFVGFVHCGFMDCRDQGVMLCFRLKSFDFWVGFLASVFFSCYLLDLVILIDLRVHRSLHSLNEQVTQKYALFAVKLNTIL